MLKHINNIFLEKKLINEDVRLTSLNYSSKSIFDELKKCLIKKEIEFDNISTKKKKEDTKKITYNFIIANLISVLNQKDTFLNYHLKNVHKNKLMKKKNLVNNIKLKFHELIDEKKSKNIKKNKKYKNIFINQIFKKSIETKNQLNELNEFNKTNFFSNLKNSFLFKINHTLSKKCNPKIFTNDDNSFYFNNRKNKKFNTLFFKNINKESNLIQEINIFKDVNKNKCFQYNISCIDLSRLEKNDEWKKAISQQILLSISNKENKAEIHFKPEYLSPIHIKIKIKNDEATLNFVSNHKKIKYFLKDSIPFLRSALIKNGIKLEKINIHKPFFEKKIISKNNKHFIKNYLIEKWKSKNFFKLKDNYKKLIHHKYIDMYV